MLYSVKLYSDFNLDFTKSAPCIVTVSRLFSCWYPVILVLQIFHAISKLLSDKLLMKIGRKFGEGNYYKDELVIIFKK